MQVGHGWEVNFPVDVRKRGNAARLAVKPTAKADNLCLLCDGSGQAQGGFHGFGSAAKELGSV